MPEYQISCRNKQPGNLLRQFAGANANGLKVQICQKVIENFVVLSAYNVLRRDS